MTLAFTCMAVHGRSQQAETEFTESWLITAKLGSGINTNFRSGRPDLYVGSVGLNPQFAVVKGLLRVGANAAAIYTDKKMSGLFGPTLAYRIKTFKTENFGSIGNLQLLAEANWGTNLQQMAGGGLAVELLSLAQIGLSVQRDYKQNNWWLQTYIAIHLKKPSSQTDRYSR